MVSRKTKKKGRAKKKKVTAQSTERMRPIQGHDIHTVEVCPGAVVLKLENGIVLQVCSNKGYVHVNFSGIGDSQVVATPMSHLGESPKHELAVANQINLFYRDPEER